MAFKSVKSIDPMKKEVVDIIKKAAADKGMRIKVTNVKVDVEKGHIQANLHESLGRRKYRPLGAILLTPPAGKTIDTAEYYELRPLCDMCKTDVATPSGICEKCEE